MCILLAGVSPACLLFVAADIRETVQFVVIPIDERELILEQQLGKASRYTDRLRVRYFPRCFVAETQSQQEQA